MSKSKKKKPVETIRLSGRNIYTDKRNRIIYYDALKKQGYLITKKNENQALFFKNRFVITLFTAILCAGTFLTWMQAAIAGVVMLVLAEAVFRLSFLKKLEPVTDIDFQRRVSALQVIIAQKERGRVIALAILYLLFAILILLNAYLEQYSMGINVLSVCLAIVGIYCSALHWIALQKMK